MVPHISICAITFKIFGSGRFCVMEKTATKSFSDAANFLSISYYHISGQLLMWLRYPATQRQNLRSSQTGNTSARHSLSDFFVLTAII
jgi:hypothetical protein